MNENTTQLDKAAHTVADYILCEKLTELLPAHGDELGAKRFLEQVRPALVNWLESREVQTAGLKDKAA